MGFDDATMSVVKFRHGYHGHQFHPHFFEVTTEKPGKLIRLYVNNILETRNKILEQLKIDINDIRNNTIDKEQKENLQKLIKYELIGF